MAARGRPASSTPQDTVEVLSDKTHLAVPGEGQTRDARASGLRALTGSLTSVGVGAVLGIARAWGWRPRAGTATAAATLGALVGANVPMTLLGVSDPRTRLASAWLADVVPHLAYGAVTAAALDALDPGGSKSHPRRT